MGNIFKKQKPASRISPQDKAILELKHQRDKLKSYQKRINDGLEKDRLLAKNLLSQGKKDRALVLLRKKRYQTTLLNNAEAQINNLEQLTADIEFAHLQTAVVEGLKVGNTALKEINATMNVDEIEALLEETREAAEKQQEITDMLSGVLTEEDEESVLQELDELMVADIEDMPQVPTEDLAAAGDGYEESVPSVVSEAKPKKAKSTEPRGRVLVETESEF